MTTTNPVRLQQAKNAYDTARVEGYAAQDVYDAAEKALRTARANTTRAAEMLIMTHEYIAEQSAGFTIG